MIKALVYLFVFCMIFTNAFALSSVITISFGISLILFLYGFLKGLPKINFKEPNFLFGLYAVLFFSYFLFATGEKKTNHLLLWTAPPLLYYYMFKRVLVKKFNLNQIIKNVIGVVYVATMVACLFAIVEFLGRNFLGIDFSFIPRGAVEDYEPGSLGGIRARSFMEESGQFSLFLEIFIPLSIYWCCRYLSSFIFKVISCIVMFAALVVSFSAVGFVCLGLGISLYFINNLKDPKRKAGTVLMLFLLLSFLIFIPDFIDLLVNVVKIKMDPDNTSHASRVSRFDALEYFVGVHMLFGYGPAAYDTLKVDSFVSFYLGLLMNTGIFGLIFYILFVLKMFYNLIDINVKSLRFVFFLSLVFSTLHYGVVDNIYVPWYWVMLSLLCAIKRKIQKGETLEVIYHS